MFSTVQAVTDALIFTLPIDVIKERAMHNPVFLAFMCRQLSDKLLNASLLHASGGLTAEYKLRKFLLFKIKQEGVQIQLENRELLAGRLGISVRQLSRALAQLAADGIIQFKTNRYGWWIANGWPTSTGAPGSSRSPALKLDAIAVRIAEVNRRSVAFRAVARFSRIDGDPLRSQIGQQFVFVERIDAQAEVIDILPVRIGRIAAFFQAGR